MRPLHQGIIHFSVPALVIGGLCVAISLYTEPCFKEQKSIEYPIKKKPDMFSPRSNAIAAIVLTWIVPSLTFSQMGFHPRTEYTRHELIDISFPWLAEENNREEIHVYKLSCPSCIQEMQAAFESDPKILGLINFSTFKKTDRLLAQCLLATVLSYSNEDKRAETFGELLHLFAFSSYQFQLNPKQWRSLCFNFWNHDDFEINDPRPWADALNWLDKQNRTIVLLDKLKYPASIELQDIHPILPIEQKTYRDQYAFVALTLPWLKYPEIHPVRGSEESPNHPEILPMIIIDPLRPIPAEQWKKHAETANSGAFWQFVGDSDVVMHRRMVEFLAGFLDLPTDNERQAAFTKALESIAEANKGRKNSLLTAIPRTKDLPKAENERKGTLIKEAKDMIGAFLAYDHARNTKGNL